MNEIFEMINPVKSYAWGSCSAIAALRGEPSPSDGPQAELWMGAHPQSPSHVVVNGREIPLDRLIDQEKQSCLGEKAARTYNGRLPYLFKVLAAQHPLSIQAHPDLDQARKGFADENRREVPLDAFNRNYRDDNHKPEIICALTPFWALCGFRKIPEMRMFLDRLCPDHLASILGSLTPDQGETGLNRFFKAVMTLPDHTKTAAIQEALKRGPKSGIDPDIIAWMARLAGYYPSDIGVLSPVFLNLIHLLPAQAMFLPSGTLHAYLEGTGIELMANSDNVLRGGLTPKHVDVPVLIGMLSFAPAAPEIRLPEPVNVHESVYQTPAREFKLSVISVVSGQRYETTGESGPEIVLCTEGEGSIEYSGKICRVSQGRSFFIPASVASYRLSGAMLLYKAGLPFDQY